MPATTAAQRWFEPVAATIAEARRFAVAATPPQIDHAETVALLVSELAANAVIHARTRYRVSVRVDGSTLTIEVHDGDPHLAVKQSIAADSTGGGRGLALVDALATRWGTDPDDDGKTTWFEIRYDT